MLLGILTAIKIGLVWGLLFVCLNPQRWILAFSSYEDKRFAFILEQVGRYIFGIIVGCISLYALNSPRDFESLFFPFVFFLSIGLIVDAFAYVTSDDAEGNQVISIIFGIVGILLFLGGGYYKAIYPETIYKEVSQKVTVEIKTELPTATNKTIFPLLSKGIAQDKIDTAMSKVPSSRSYEQGETSLAKVGDEMLFIATLEPGSYWKSKKKDFVAPGYISIPSTNSVSSTKYEGDMAMKYTPGAYYNNSLERKIRQKYPKAVLLEESFELDEEKGKKYFSYSYGEYFKTTSYIFPVGIILVDAETGEMKKYKAGDEPDFVDRVYSVESADNTFNYYFNYKEGWWNANVTKSDVVEPDGNWLETFDENNELIYVNQFVRAKGKGGIVGYGVFYAKTGKAVFYDVAGFLNKENSDVSYISDSKAISVAEENSLIKDAGKGSYHGVLALFYQVYDEPAYIVPIYDNSNTFQGLAIIRADSSNTVVGFGKTKEEAFNSYKMALSEALRKKGDFTPSEEFQTKTIEGVVHSKESIVNQGVTTIYLSLEGDKNIYTINPVKFPQSAVTLPGETVELKVFEATDNAVVPVEEFTNVMYR